MELKFLNKQSLDLIESVYYIMKINNLELITIMPNETDEHNYILTMDIRGKDMISLLEYRVQKNKFKLKEYNERFQKLLLTSLIYLNFNDCFINK